MGTKENAEAPMVQLVSFNKLLKHYEEQLTSKDKSIAARAKYVLDAQAPYPELREGFNDYAVLEKRKDVISIILADTFSPVLTRNEIKAATVPFENLIFNSSERFQTIIENAGIDFDLAIRSMSHDMHYTMQCSVILSVYYGFNLDFKRPLFYDIPDKNGIIRHYRILYNADFIEIIATDKAKDLTKEDFDQLLENFEDVALWKEKIPPGSFIAKGFVISSLFDVTVEHSISEIKSTLIAGNHGLDSSFMDSFQGTFRSLFNLKHISVGFAGYDADNDQFVKVYNKGMQSFILNGKDKEGCGTALCSSSYRKLLEDKAYYVVTNISKYYKLSGGKQPYKSFYDQGIESIILAPIANNGNLLGVLELVSKNVNELNSVNANKLVDVMPFIVSAVARSIEEEENLIDAVIQHECTRVHSSVYWKFKEEAKKFIHEELSGEHPTFKEIVFKNVHPLYGQIDIKESSHERNVAIQRDLMIQMSEIKDILNAALEKLKLPIYEELIYRTDTHLAEIKGILFSNSEQSIFDFVQSEIIPVFHHLKREDAELEKLVTDYENRIDAETESYYDHRRNYDNSVMQVNKKLATLIDKRQEEAQKMFPHYFERYKTDGVEHNIYIGEEIAGNREFDDLYLKNLRLWQLQVMVEMENAHYKLKPKLPIPLDVASLMLVYSTSLAIRFRMDEKKFDVDGTYNARYEVIKKRIDKSHIKDTKERLTQQGKLAIVYSQIKDEKEYLRYITFLQAKGYFTKNIEIVELEGLQGVTGLKAIRAEILYKKNAKSQQTYTYEDLMEELNS